MNGILRGTTLASDERRRAWRYYAGLHAGSGRRLAQALLVLVAQAATLLAIPLAVSVLFDRLGSPGQSISVVAWGIGIVVLYVLNGAASAAGRHFLIEVTSSVTCRLRHDLVAKVFGLSPVAWENADRSLLENSVVQDAERIDAMSMAALATALPSCILSGLLAIALLWMEPILLATMLLAGPLLFLTDRALGARVGKLAGEHRRALATLGHRFSGALRRVTQLRAEAIEHVEVAIEEDLAVEARGRRRRLADAGTVYSVAQVMIVHAVSAMVLIVGGISVAAGTLTLGTLVAFYVGLMLLKNYVTAVMQCVPVILEGEAALRGVVAILELDAAEPYRGRGHVDFDGSLRLQRVSYAYDGRNVLEDVDLELEPGRVTAVVGANGAGKSTLADLVLGLRRPDSGTVLASGQALDQLDVRALRSRIGYVPQQPILPQATVGDCLRFGRPDATAADVQDALRVSTADAVVASLPGGLNADLGEESLRLSGGERQRLAIARALVHRPSLLVLDEPTNHLDTTAVQRFLDQLATLSPRPTVLLITHDRSVLDACDRILELLPLAEAKCLGRPQLAEAAPVLGDIAAQ